MVLPLQKLCLAALRDSLKDRPNPYLHRIPPPNHRQNLRQDLLDLVLASRVISQESAYTSLSSPEFLDGLSKLNTQRGITSDGEFLDRVADSLSVQLNGKTIGEGITELKLNIFVWRSGDVYVALNLDSAVRVISQCPNLKILHLFIGEDKLGRKRWQDKNMLAGLPEWFDDLSSDGGILNQVPELAPCLGVLENVEELSLLNFADVTCWWRILPCLTRKRPIVFHRLSSLRLFNVKVDAEAWKEFLMPFQNSLIELDVHSVYGLTAEGTKLVMPFPLPNLRSFTMECSGPYTLQLIKNLMECPKLEKVKMALRADSENENAMRLLSQMNVSLELGICLEVNQDRDSNFKLVNLFKEKIKKVGFRIFQWRPQHSMALEKLFAACHELVEISFSPTSSHRLNLNEDENEGENDIEEADNTDVLNNRLMATVNSDLAPFFRDQAFVSKLRKLELGGAIDSAVLDALFENAVNLESLSIRYCPQFTDSHLQLWASRGGKPKYLHIWNCENITDHGLVPIFISSGERMICFTLSGDWSNRITEVTWRTLFNHCPFFDCPDHLLDQLIALFGSNFNCPEYLRQ